MSDRRELVVGEVWRHKGNPYRTITIVSLVHWGGERHVYPRRNTSRRRQSISEKTLRKEYR